MKTSKHKKIEYDYYVHSVGEGGDAAYKALIPAFDNAVVFGDSLKELEEGIRFTIDSEIAEKKRLKKPVPEPELKSQFSGKVLIRIAPFVHEKIFLEAKAAGQSLNKYIEKRLSN